jgi:hypothetical protein
VELRDWILTEHDGVRARFEQSVLGVVPLDLWRERPGGGSSIAFLVLHTAYHQDVALSSVLGGQPPLREEWASRLGLAGVPADQGLAETEPFELTDLLSLEQLDGYAQAVTARSRELLAGLGVASLDTMPDSAKGLSEIAGVEESAVPWLYKMWDGKPASFFVSWEDIGHGLNHLGEMVSVRNRLGLSPF